MASRVAHTKFKRSPDPIVSRTTGTDNLINYKNVESLDNNDVELSGRIVNISPSKIDQNFYKNELKQTVHSGEEQRAPQGNVLFFFK